MYTLAQQLNNLDDTMLVKFESQWDKKIKSHKGKTEKHFVFCLVKAKIISHFLIQDIQLLCAL